MPPLNVSQFQVYLLACQKYLDHTTAGKIRVTGIRNFVAILHYRIVRGVLASYMRNCAFACFQNEEFGQEILSYIKVYDYRVIKLYKFFSIKIN